jgi:DNA polymerase III gamma/tau subunit
MSITQTYFLAHKARAKLSSQAARPDHNLRLLVGHANLLDTLMLELADAEREQESWFNQSVQQSSASAQAQQEKERHVQWADTIIEEPEEDWQAEDADNDSESDASSDSFSDSDDDIYDDEDEEDSASSIDDDDLMADSAPLQRVDSKTVINAVEVDAETDDDAEFDDEAQDAHLSLTRSASHSSISASLHMSSPPDLVIEEDSDDLLSDDDAAMPLSPPAVSLQSFSKTASKPSTTTPTIVPTSPQQQDQEHEDFHDSQEAHYFVPPRNPARLAVY